jgi:hypothetical protein
MLGAFVCCNGMLDRPPLTTSHGCEKPGCFVLPLRSLRTAQARGAQPDESIAISVAQPCAQRTRAGALRNRASAIRHSLPIQSAHFGAPCPRAPSRSDSQPCRTSRLYARTLKALVFDVQARPNDPGVQLRSRTRVSMLTECRAASSAATAC